MKLPITQDLEAKRTPVVHFCSQLFFHDSQGLGPIQLGVGSQVHMLKTGILSLKNTLFLRLDGSWDDLRCMGWRAHTLSIS